MGNYVNPDHPAGALYPQSSGFMKGTANREKTGSRHGSLAQQAHRNWIADQANEAKRLTAPATKRAA